jgi:hypothetical protein
MTVRRSSTADTGSTAGTDRSAGGPGGSAREAADAGRQVADRARHSRTLTVTTRAGLACYGVVHLLIAWLAVQIAFGRAPAEGDQSGAFQVVARQPGGRALLVVMVLGLAAMAVWQALLAVVGYAEEDGWRKVAERLGSAARAVIYGAFAVSAAKVALAGGSSSAGKQENATSGVLGLPGGRVLVFVAALVIFGVGVGLAVYGITSAFLKRLETGRMSPGTRRAARVLGLVGYLGKGVAYGIVGVLVGLAALRFDPDRARGLDAALRTTAAQPYGVVLLSLIALGFAAFGLYCFLQARYRKV